MRKCRQPETKTDALYISASSAQIKEIYKIYNFSKNPIEITDGIREIEERTQAEKPISRRNVRERRKIQRQDNARGKSEKTNRKLKETMQNLGWLKRDFVHACSSGNAMLMFIFFLWCRSCCMGKTRHGFGCVFVFFTLFFFFSRNFNSRRRKLNKFTAN